MILVVSVLVVHGIHIYRDYANRINANQIIEAIEKFRWDRHQYPTTLGQIGIDATKALRNSGLYYAVYIGKPSMTYDATFMLGDYWIYDFSAHNWLYISP